MKSIYTNEQNDKQSEFTTKVLSSNDIKLSSEYSILKMFKIVHLCEILKKALSSMPEKLKILLNTNTSNTDNSYNKSKESTDSKPIRRGSHNNIKREYTSFKLESEFISTEKNYYEKLIEEQEKKLNELIIKQKALKDTVNLLKDSLNENKSNYNTNKESDNYDLSKSSDTDNLVKLFFKYECKSPQCVLNLAKYILMRLEYDERSINTFNSLI